MEVFEYPRHSYLYGLKQWFIGFIIMIIICATNRDLEIISLFYIFSIVLLIGYNIRSHRKRYYGLVLQTARKNFYLRSDNKEFINKIYDIFKDAMDSKHENYTINFDNYNIINNGIINKGNNNENKVIKKDDSK